jgi:hypothetical protein
VDYLAPNLVDWVKRKSNENDDDEPEGKNIYK